jgi:hypothetical protein
MIQALDDTGEQTGLVRGAWPRGAILPGWDQPARRISTSDDISYKTASMLLGYAREHGGGFQRSVAQQRCPLDGGLDPQKGEQ